MCKFWLDISRIFLFAAFSLMLFATNPAEAAGFQLFGTSEEPDVSFEATDIIVDGDQITIKGNFKNHTDNFQRVTSCTIYYQFYDEEGVSIIDGAYKIENLSIEVGSELAPYTLTVENKEASIRDVVHEAHGWKVRSSVKIEK